MNTIEYNGYNATLNYDDEIGMFYGRVMNTKDIITFYGKSVNDLRREMKISIDDYIKLCAERNLEPAKPYSGKFNVRIPPELHMKASVIAAAENISLNALIENALTEAVH